MKILLVAVNAKYIHSNLAVYSLTSYAEKQLPKEDGLLEIPQIEIAEYTINQPMGKILTDIYMKKPDLVLFSCYIWNRREIEELITDLSKIMPDVDIWIGGPEVSFDAQKTLELINAKGIICGEGEEVFCSLACAYANSHGIDSALCDIAGIVYRDNTGKIIVNNQHVPMDLSDVPFPYDDLENFEHRIIYYESSRGCPFRCSYCLSSVEKSLRFRDMELVKKELAFFLDKNVPQVKFIDRTFNCNHEHAMEIWKFLKSNDNGITNFHFEIAGDLLNDEELDLLGSMRIGQVQLEIGVQSTNEQTLHEINRPMSFELLSRVVETIKVSDNMHLHLDLIAGLPFEDYESFAKSFNDVFSLRPHQLQLGFLKVLKGSPIANRQEEYGLKYTEFPPYEVLETNWISYDELIKLKAVEEMVEIYYNSGQFANTIEILIEYAESAFDLFEKLAAWYGRQGMDMLNFSRNTRYENLLKFSIEIIPSDEADRLKEAMIFDFYLRENAKTRPDFLGEDNVEKTFSKEFYSRESREHRYLAGDRCDTDDPRLLRKLTHLEKTGDKYYLFDYTRRSPMTNNARITEICD